jgi:apolipoprotein N-acyltransferase
MTPANWMSYADPLGEGSLAAPVVAAFGAAGAGLLLLQINALAVAVVGVAGCSWWRSWRRGLPSLLLLLSLVYLPWLCASWPVEAGAGNGVASAPALRVAQVAPLIAPGMTESERDKAARLLDAYRQLDPAAIDLALLPQSAFDGVDWQRPEDLRWVLSAVAARGIPLLAGARQIVQRAAADGSGTEISYNVAVLLLPMQARQLLDGGDAAMGNAALPWQGKRYLVPLSEYTPDWLPEWLGRPQQARLSTYIGAAQSRPLPLPVGIDKEMSLGVMLCYDAYHPNVADDLRRAGAEVLLVVSSDLSFSGSALSRQGLRTARLRAMEQGLPLLRIAWSEYGSSAFGADGETLPPIAGAWPAGVRVYALPKPHGSGVRGGRSKATPAV